MLNFRDSYSYLIYFKIYESSPGHGLCNMVIDVSTEVMLAIFSMRDSVKSFVSTFSSQLTYVHSHENVNMLVLLETHPPGISA